MVQYMSCGETSENVEGFFSNNWLIKLSKCQHASDYEFS